MPFAVDKDEAALELADVPILQELDRGPSGGFMNTVSAFEDRRNAFLSNEKKRLVSPSVWLEPWETDRGRFRRR
jgi:hypothetical protein